MTAQAVLYGGSLTEQDDYRNAVSIIIGDIQRSATPRLSLIDIADSIDVSVVTISNAYNRKSDLSAIFLKRLGTRYGAAFLNPYFALMGAQAAPIKRKPQRDVLPILTKVTHKIACARDPEGPGGQTEIPQEKKAYLPDLKEAQHEIGCLISEVEAI